MGTQPHEQTQPASENLSNTDLFSADEEGELRRDFINFYPLRRKNASTNKDSDSLIALCDDTSEQVLPDDRFYNFFERCEM